MLLPIFKQSLHNPFLYLSCKIPLIIPAIACNVIIGPHGITDLIHAIEYKKIFKLLSVYGSSVTFFRFMQINSYENTMNSIFLMISALHFRHDVPLQNNFMQLFFTILFTMNLDKIGFPLFLVYMSFLHVPNHYLTYSDLIKKRKRLSYLSILFISIILSCTTYNTMNLYNNKKYLLEGFITGHIIYEELYSKNKKRNLLIDLFRDDGKNMAIYI